MSGGVMSTLVCEVVADADKPAECRAWRRMSQGKCVNAPVRE